jgi:hypothetical protein
MPVVASGMAQVWCVAAGGMGPCRAIIAAFSVTAVVNVLMLCDEAENTLGHVGAQAGSPATELATSHSSVAALIFNCVLVG